MTEINNFLTDIAVNLTDPSLQKDLSAILERARSKGVHRLVVTASTLEESQAALDLCRQHPDILMATAGTHPHNAKERSASDSELQRQLIHDPLVCAIGETGLDFNRDFSPRPQQLAIFEQQLALAAETGKALLLHERDAHQPFLERLRALGSARPAAVLHCFTGRAEELHRYLELDLYIGITGWVCDERRGQHLIDLLPSIPRDRLLLETDSPYLLPRTLRPKPKSRRNEPAHLRHICEFVAEKLQIDSNQLAQQTSKNAARLFNWPQTNLQ